MTNTNAERARADEARRDDPFWPVDCSTGVWDEIGDGWGQRAMVVDDLVDLNGQPEVSEFGDGIFDPLCWRFHRLDPDDPEEPHTARRLSVASVNDYEGPWEHSREDGLDSPWAQTEAWSADNRSTRERDLQGRAAIPGTMRKIVDSEDDRYALAQTFSELGLRSSSADLPQDLADTTGGGYPPGVHVLTGGIGATGKQTGLGDYVTIQGVSYFGGAAVRAAQQASVPGATAGDVHRAVRAAVSGVPSPPATRTHTTGETHAPDPPRNPAGSYGPHPKPGGYVWNGERIGSLSTIYTLEEEEDYFVNHEGTPLGPIGLRHDAHFAMSGKTGRIMFVDNDVAELDEGSGKLVKGSMFWDSSRANVDTDVGGEGGQWVPAIRVDAKLPPAAPPPPDPGASWIHVPEDDETKTKTKVITGGGGNPPPTSPIGKPGAGSGKPPKQPKVPQPRVAVTIGEDFETIPIRKADGTTTSGGRPITGGGSGGPAITMGGNPPLVVNPQSQERDYSGEGVPCPNATSGRAVAIPSPDVIDQIKGLERPSTGGSTVIDQHGFPAINFFPGLLMVGGQEIPPDQDLVGDFSFGIPGGGVPGGIVVSGPSDDPGHINLGLGGGGGVPGGIVVSGPSDAPGRITLGIGGSEAARRRAQADRLEKQIKQHEDAAKDKKRNARDRQRNREQVARLRAEQQRLRESANKLGKNRGFEFIPGPDDGIPQLTDRQAAAVNAARKAAKRKARKENAETEAKRWEEEADRRANSDNPREQQTASRYQEQAKKIRERLKEIEQREQDREDYAKRKHEEHEERQRKAREKREARKQKRREDEQRVRDAKRRRREKEGKPFREDEPPKAPPQGAYVIDTTIPDGELFSGTFGLPDGLEGVLDVGYGGSHGDWNVANTPIPLFGAEGSPTSLEDYLHLAAHSLRANQAILNAVFGGPSYFAGNMAVQATNRWDMELSPSRIGQHYRALNPDDDGEFHLGVPALEVVSTVTTYGQDVIAQGGGILEVRRIEEEEPPPPQDYPPIEEIYRDPDPDAPDGRTIPRVGGGSTTVHDTRPLILLGNGQGEGDLVADTTGRTRLTGGNKVAAACLQAAVLAGDDASMHPFSVGQAGGDDITDTTNYDEWIFADMDGVLHGELGIAVKEYLALEDGAALQIYADGVTSTHMELVGGADGLVSLGDPDAVISANLTVDGTVTCDKLDVQGGLIDPPSGIVFEEQSSDPMSGSQVGLYAGDTAGANEPFWRRDDGSVIELGEAGAGGGTSVLNSETSAAVDTSSDGNEHDMHSYTIPADTLGTNGDTITLTAWGTGGNATDGERWRVYLGGVVIGDLSTTGGTAPANPQYRILVTITRRAASGAGSFASEALLACYDANGQQHKVDFGLDVSTNIDWSSAQVLKITAQEPSGNGSITLTQHQHLVELKSA